MPSFVSLTGLLLAVVAVLLPSAAAWSALLPDELLIVANKNVRAGVELAGYYMQQRGVPPDHLVQLALTDKEECSQQEYLRQAAAPLRSYLREHDPAGRIRCLVLMYGLPLRIAPPPLPAEDKQKLKQLNERRRALEEALKGQEADRATGREELTAELGAIRGQIKQLDNSDQESSLDSEIGLVLADEYPLAGWLPNVHFAGNRDKVILNMPHPVLLVSRLDGPSTDTVRRIIDDSIAVERRGGLKGTAYFDARWPKSADEQRKKTDPGYEFYDLSIHLAADRVRKSGRLPVEVDDKPTLFQPGECPAAALYCGWYSLATYIDAFIWQPGAVGFHIASAECSTLKQPGSTVWCKKMLEKGVAATVGPVSEPYVQGFPVPEVFFGTLLDGSLTLAECYALAQPFVSWRMVLIGDPLYMPFKKRGQ